MQGKAADRHMLLPYARKVEVGEVGHDSSSKIYTENYILNKFIAIIGSFNKARTVCL